MPLIIPVKLIECPLPKIKNTLINWLKNNQIQFNPVNNKSDLLKLIKIHSQTHKPKYVVDELAQMHGHLVVRLPPYHSELKPIENLTTSSGKRTKIFSIKKI